MNKHAMNITFSTLAFQASPAAATIAGQIKLKCVT